MERKRPAASIGTCLSISVHSDTLSHSILDRLRWYCRSGKHETPIIIREEAFHCEDLGTQLKPLISNWINNPELRKCNLCGVVADAK